MDSESALDLRVIGNDGPYFNEYLLKVLSSNTRLEILKHLSESQMTLTDLARVLDFCKSTVFEHLKKLYEAGLVYRITEPRVAFLLFGTGKIVCTGGRSIKDIRAGLEKLKGKLEEIGIAVKAA